MSYKLLYRATIDLPVTTIILEATIILQTTIKANSGSRILIRYIYKLLYYNNLHR